MIFRILTGQGTLQQKFIQAIAFIVAIIGAIVMHELAHGLVALMNGDRTAKDMGRLSLNPAAHLDWSGIIMFLVVGIGWAKPVPVNFNNFKKEKLGIISVALAGVAMNFLVAFASFGLLIAMGAIENGVALSEFAFVVVNFLYYIFFFSTLINIALIAFNLLPLYPLDGFRVVEALTPPNNRFVVFMRRYSLYIFMGLILLRIIPALDILGMYLGAISNLIMRFFNLILGA